MTPDGPFHLVCSDTIVLVSEHTGRNVYWCKPRSRGSRKIGKIPAFFCLYADSGIPQRITIVEIAMCFMEPTKEAYVSPGTKNISMETFEGLMIISNPGGTVLPIDDDEE